MCTTNDLVGVLHKIYEQNIETENKIEPRVV